jgi:iron-sulfur cluster assembly protein/iron-sulfur cluster insertion protein
MTQILSIKSSQPQKTVNLTDSAVAKVRELIAGEDEAGLALRMAVRPGGCSGFSYEMYFDAEVDDSDIVEEFEDVRVLVDSQSAEMVRGSTLDYKEGLMGAGFAIDNPTLTRSCGCGNSFSCAGPVRARPLSGLQCESMIRRGTRLRPGPSLCSVRSRRSRQEN